MNNQISNDLNQFEAACRMLGVEYPVDSEQDLEQDTEQTPTNQENNA